MLIFDKWFPKLRKIIKKHEKKMLWLVLVSGFFVYLISIIGYMGVEKFVKDFDVFLMWSKMLLDDGLKGFMTEYPPFGLYILAAIQWFLRLFGLGDHYLAALLTMKMPSILASLLIAFLAYKWMRKNDDSINPILMMIILAFNPAFIINASMWGQMDMLMILFAVLSFYYLKSEKYILSAVFYTIGCLVKPQMIFFAPIFGMFVIIPLFGKRSFKENVGKIALAALISVGLFFMAALPFKESITDIWIVDFFNHISEEHPVNTASAFNLFGLHGGSFQPYTDGFLLLNYKVWGYIFIGLTCVGCAMLCYRNRKEKAVFLLAAFCIAAVFTLGVSMHERYILAGVPMIALSYIYMKRKPAVFLYLGYTFLAVINQSIILFDLFGGKTWTFRTWSGISVALFICLAVYVIVEVVLKRDPKRLEIYER
jgi:Gpi18-like mannosyltransferase